MKQILRANSRHITTIATEIQLIEYLPKVDQAIALCGRSNVGKSTFINAFFKNNLARVSNTPGKTKEVQVFTFEVQVEDEIKTFTAFDLPGYGHAKVSKTERARWDLLLDNFFQIYHEKCLFIHLMDALNPFQKNDESFIKYFRRFHSDYWMIFNKVDKLKNQSARAKFKNFQKTLKNKSYAISADKKQNLELLESDLIDYLFKN